MTCLRSCGGKGGLERGDDTWARVAVPAIGAAFTKALPSPSCGLVVRLDDTVRAERPFGHSIRAFRDGNRALGLRSQRHARYAEDRRFLLDAAGIGEDAARPTHEAEHLAVPNRIEHLKRGGRLFQPESFDLCTCSRV